ncbi:DUF4476 domain-containing protein [Chryseobacterium defluvii]|uniref:Uncharacterized protein DUF4476 n=1 Tax=Chryseobacterium defluvii TaxID=160396 RepID=A0A495SNY7_9FLAO|nr:DUF4476 domain-containing protein [Chryseobacterium defluvii]RKT01998.1 uncharacterized protein DUF4476 [Chryseobacterium defluvii]
MRKIFTTCVFLLSFSIFAQEAGKAGELLKNEASKTEMQTRRNDAFGKSNEGINNTNYRNPNKNKENYGSPVNGEKRTSNYRWNQNYGYSEVFIRIPEQGYFTIELGDQMISNPSGKYRFFDLPSGRIPVSIYENGYLLYRTSLMVRNNSRMVLDFFSDYGLYLLNTSPVQGYGFNDWNDIWNNPYGNSGSQWNQGNGHVMDNVSFYRFMDMMKRSASFDKDKSAMIMQQARGTMFTAQQMQSLLKSLDFDKNRLELAKSIYRKCADRENFFVVYEAFDFDSSRRDLMNYISKS